MDHDQDFEDYFEDKITFKLFTKNSFYNDAPLYLTLNATSVDGCMRDPGREGEFFVVEAQYGYNRLQSVKWPNYFLYENSDGYAYVRNDGSTIKDDALFLMTSLGDGSIAVRSKKWPNNRMCMANNTTSVIRVVFSKSEEDNGKWYFQEGEAIDEILLSLPTASDDVETDGPVDKSDGSLPKDLRLPTKIDKEDDLISYELAHGRGIVDADLRPGVSYAARRVIARWVSASCDRSKSASTLFTFKTKKQEIRLDNQGDVENPPKSGRWFANLQVQIGDQTVAQALVEIGKTFGKRRIRMVLMESLQSQYRVRLTKVPTNRRPTGRWKLDQSWQSKTQKREKDDDEDAQQAYLPLPKKRTSHVKRDP